MITIYDISEKSGFAPGTVSKALNNYYGVNAETRRKFWRLPSKWVICPMQTRVR